MREQIFDWFRLVCRQLIFNAFEAIKFGILRRNSTHGEGWLVGLRGRKPRLTCSLQRFSKLPRQDSGVFLRWPEFIKNNEEVSSRKRVFSVVDEHISHCVMFKSWSRWGRWAGEDLIRWTMKLLSSSRGEIDLLDGWLEQTHLPCSSDVKINEFLIEKPRRVQCLVTQWAPHELWHQPRMNLHSSSASFVSTHSSSILLPGAQDVGAQMQTTLSGFAVWFEYKLRAGASLLFAHLKLDNGHDDDSSARWCRFRSLNHSWRVTRLKICFFLAPIRLF